MFTHLKSLLEDEESKKLQRWQDEVRKAYPDHAPRMKFKSGGKKEDHLVYAEVPGMDRAFGVFNLDTLKGEILGEAQLDEVWNDSDAEDANGRWAEYRDGKISLKDMARWLYRSRTHKKSKVEKLQSAYGAISQQQNTSKLINGKQAEALRSELKRLYEGIDDSTLAAAVSKLKPADGYVVMKFFTSGEKAQFLALVDEKVEAAKAFSKVLATADEKLRHMRGTLRSQYAKAHDWAEIDKMEN